MPLDPQVVAFIEQARAAGVAPASQVGAAQARRTYDDAAQLLFGAPDAVAAVTDLDADGVPVRVYVPDAAGPGATVYFHGGGWVIGGLASHDPLCRTLAARSGSTLIAVDYRLAPEHVYPAAIEDAWTATRWAAGRHAPLAVAGDSAGGQLAASVALRARDEGLALALQALIYPVTDHAGDTPSWGEPAEEAVLSPELMRWFWDQYVPDPARAAEPDCSPLRAAEVAGVAPALVITAESDPLRDEGEAYARRLADAGVAVELTRYDGLVHGFLRMRAMIDRAGDAIDQVAAALRSALSTAPSDR